MEAEEPQHGAPTPIPAMEEFSVIPEALTSSCQTPVVGPEAQGGQDPFYKWAEGLQPLETQQRDLRDVNDCASESMTSLPKEAPEDVETNQENVTAEARNTPERQGPADRQAKTPAPPELWVFPVQGECQDPVPIPSELSSRVEVEFSPELAALRLGAGRAEEEEETSPGASAQTRCWPSWEEHPAESHPPQDSESRTIRQGEELQPREVQGSRGREGLVCPQEAEGLEEQGLEELDFPGGGTPGAAVCSDGVLVGRKQVGEQADGTEGGQRQRQEQLQEGAGLAKRAERGALNGESGLPNYDKQESKSQGQEELEQAEQREREPRGPGERRGDTQREGNQSLVGESVNVAAEQEHEALRGKLMPEEEEEDEEEAEAAAAAAGSSEEEPASWEGAALPGAGVERSTARGEERDGPPTRTPVAPEVSSPCDLLPDTWDATARIPGTQTEPGAEELSPVALTPTLEPVGRSLQAISLPSSFPVLESSDQETAQDSRQEGPTLGEGAASSRATEVASGSASDTPPRTPGWGPCSPAEASTCTTASPPASPPVAVPRKKPSLAACSPDTSGAFSLTDQPPLWGASDTLPAPLHGCPAAEASMDPWASPPSPPATSAGAARHPRSSSFPGSHRTQPAPDLAGASLSFSHSELPQRPPKPSVSGSVIPRRDRKSSRGCSSIPESPSSLSIWGQVPRESTLSPERPGSPRSAQPWARIHTFSAPGHLHFPLSRYLLQLPLNVPLKPQLLHSSPFSDTRGPAMEKPLSSSDTIVFREKKPKELMGGFSRRRSKLINSSQLLYQEYSDVALNKEIQSQQRLDSLAEAPGPASPRQPRRTLVSSESYLQRLSMASSSSLWQEIPVVRNSTVLLSMTHEDQKLQEAKFELIVSEASYLRSLNIAVDHFQHSARLRAVLSNQDQQWLFSRLQDVRDVSTMFLSDLEENFENNIFTFHVCDVVLNHASNFRRVYLPYVTNQSYQERTFQNLLSTNGSFREVLEKLESDPVCQRLSLKSFLILPFQRITRLKLLLQNILKRTQPGSSEEAEATKAHHALEELIRDCNNNVQRMRRTEELIYLSQKIEFECKIFPLISQSRWLVKSGELTALEFSVSPGLRRKLNTRPVHLHLFNDCLLLSRPREGSRFLVFDHAPFSSVRGEKCEMKLHGPHKNLFRLFLLHNTQGTQAEFLFRTETQSEKLRWISALAMPREELDLLECCDSPQVQCLRAYKPRENDELALEKADVVMVTQQSSDGWLEGVRLSDGERGWFPVQQVEFISNAEVRAQNLKEAQRVKTAKLQLVERQT
ncbi:rho guanine nucleotide exchange factor 5 [Pteropus vampyrus]|uniref:Rho guanine nucleotide exchange factor 5 n=1 Tax=Pteropus vampyrus TaxID=132908 RepID=A0A6P6CPX1_PTEVA|nr:rho guanine nucleotide exchange factor 5 [Pteropus vampyrus]